MIGVAAAALLFAVTRGTIELRYWTFQNAWNTSMLGTGQAVVICEDARSGETIVRLGSNLLKQVRWTDTEPMLRECLAIREKVLPDDWSRFNAMSLLGESLLGQRRYSEAVPLVAPGYEEMKSREAKVPTPS
jgi:hypothetical protein